MKRKINRVGTNTLTVSLPSTWAKSLNLKQGHELYVKQEKEKLILSPEDLMQGKKQEITLTLNSTDKIYLRSVLGALYRKGYDIIRIRFEDETTFKILKECTYHIIGFEIMDYTNHSCLIKSMLDETKKEYYATQHKIINIIKTTSKTAYEDYITQNLIHLEDLEEYRYNVWKLRDYALRIMSKKIDSDEINSSHATIFWTLEKINRDYKRIYQTLIDHKLTYDTDLDSYFSSVNDFLTYFLKNISSTDIASINQIHNHYKENLKKGSALLTNKKDESIVIHHLMGIVNRIQDMSSSLIIKNIQ